MLLALTSEVNQHDCQYITVTSHDTLHSRGVWLYIHNRSRGVCSATGNSKHGHMTNKQKTDLLEYTMGNYGSLDHLWQRSIIFYTLLLKDSTYVHKISSKLWLFPLIHFQAINFLTPVAKFVELTKDCKKVL